MNTKYQYIAGLQESTGEIIYSRSPHDFRSSTDSLNWVDGGQDYFRQVWDSSKTEPLKQIVIELNVPPSIVFDDWNYERNQYGITHIDRVRIVPESEYEDKTSFEYKKKYATWGTYGPKGDQPRRTVMLTNADTDHLLKILETQIHIGREMADIIRSILKDRGIHAIGLTPDNKIIWND
jgi:hypothetical protein